MSDGLIERLVGRWLQEVGYLGANDDVRRDARFFLRAIADELEAVANAETRTADGLGEGMVEAVRWLREQAGMK